MCTTFYLLKVRTCYLKYLNNGNPKIMKKYLGRQENNRDNWTKILKSKKKDKQPKLGPIIEFVIHKT